MEFCTEKELVAQTGHEAHKWPLVVVKELVDNGIDACEERKIAPVIKVTITTGKPGGRGVYFSDPNGHVLELMTVPQ